MFIRMKFVGVRGTSVLKICFVKMVREIKIQLQDYEFSFKGHGVFSKTVSSFFFFFFSVAFKFIIRRFCLLA